MVNHALIIRKDVSPVRNRIRIVLAVALGLSVAHGGTVPAQASTPSFENILQNAYVAAIEALPTGSAAYADYDAAAWEEATEVNVVAAYAAYAEGWYRGGPAWINQNIDDSERSAIRYETIDQGVYDSIGKAAQARKMMEFWRSGLPTAEANTQAAQNRVAELYADFTPVEIGVQVAPKAYGVTEVAGTNGIVDGKAQVTIAVDGYEFTWVAGSGTFVTYWPDEPQYTTPGIAKRFTTTSTPKISGTAKVG